MIIIHLQYLNGIFLSDYNQHILYDYNTFTVYWNGIV